MGYQCDEHLADSLTLVIVFPKTSWLNVVLKGNARIVLGLQRQKSHSLAHLLPNQLWPMVVTLGDQHDKKAEPTKFYNVMS